MLNENNISILNNKIGDGIVGGRDYVIAKLFDKDKDGKLN